MMILKEEFKAMIAGCRAGAFDGLVEALETTAPETSIRWNRGKMQSPSINRNRVPWEAAGEYLAQRPAFTLDPRMHQGRYYVQDASSMIIGEVIRRLVAGGDRPLAYLDACAAPGGKTTAAIDSLPEGSLVVANEYVPKRAAILEENLTKWGYEGTVVSRGDTARFRKLREVFDIVAVDAPCSGEGMMRKDEEAARQWSPALVEECAARQREILGNVWGSLRDGGYLIYSTCTFNPVENERVVAWLRDEMGATPVALDFPEEWGIAREIEGTAPCYRFLPHRLKGEGLFLAVLRKGNAIDFNRLLSPSIDFSRSPREAPINAIDFYRDQSTIQSTSFDFNRFQSKDGRRTPPPPVIFPPQWLPLLKELQRELKVSQWGVETAVPKGKGRIPSHALAMWRGYPRETYPEVEVDEATALQYLRREAISVDAPRGIVLLIFDGYPLGWVNNLGNRANNLYPQDWRIRNL